MKCSVGEFEFLFFSEDRDTLEVLPRRQIAWQCQLFLLAAPQLWDQEMLGIATRPSWHPNQSIEMVMKTQFEIKPFAGHITFEALVSGHHEWERHMHSPTKSCASARGG